MRCFLAIELPEGIRHRLQALQQELCELDGSVRWAGPEQMHLTLKFLGEVRDEGLAEVCAAARAAAATQEPFRLEIRGTGCFPPHGPPRVLWAGVQGDLAVLQDLQQRCEELIGPLGYPPEARSFSPHLTLGRVREGRSVPAIRGLLADRGDFFAGHFTASVLTLFESQLRRGGSLYTPLAHLPLAG